MTLNVLSPKAYYYTRANFNLCLPHPRTLSKWNFNVDGTPGFTSESFITLRKLISNSSEKVVCSLSIDEMCIHRQTEFDGIRYFGYITLGESVENPQTVATDVFVFMLVSMNQTWKLPLGYFFVSSLNGSRKKQLLEVCLQQLYEIGVTVACVTFDAANSNMGMSSALGCDLRKQCSSYTFIYNEEKKALVLDPSHMIKLVRNAFGETGPFYDEEGNLVDWEFVRKLQTLQEAEGLHLTNKLRKAHVNLIFSQQYKLSMDSNLLPC